MAWALIAAALIPGCRKTPPPIVEVEGIVRLDGVPLNKAEVRFIPIVEFGASHVARGTTDEAGRFKLTCNGRAGACLGENRVIVVEGELPARVKGENAQAELEVYRRSLGGRPLPERYGNLVDSPLTANVQADQKEYTFELTR